MAGNIGPRQNRTQVGSTHLEAIPVARTMLAAVEERLGQVVRCERWDDRDPGRGYYPSFCSKVDGCWDDEWIEIGDGGIVDWSQRLLDSEKERAVTSGASVERLAGLIAP